MDVRYGTSLSRRIYLTVVFACMLPGACRQSSPLFATLTLKKDGSHFSGTVVRREANSITVTGSGGDTHTFIYDELSNITYGVPGSAGASGPAASGSARNAAVTVGGVGHSFELPAGTVLRVTNVGLIDSSYVAANWGALAAMDADLVGADGKVLIPAGANLSITVRDQKTVSGHVEMQFELGSADFGNTHYLIASAKGGLEPGAVLTLSGPQKGTAESKARGDSLHLDDHSLMLFRTATPTVVQVSQ